LAVFVFLAVSTEITVKSYFQIYFWPSNTIENRPLPPKVSYFWRVCLIFGGWEWLKNVLFPVVLLFFDPQPDTAVRGEEPTSDEVLNVELPLAVTFEVLHHVGMAAKSRSLSTEELDLVGFLVTQVASLSSSLVVEMTCEAAITVPLAPPPLAREVMDLQPGPVVSPAPPPVVVDASVSVVGSSTTPLVAWVLQATA
jgi:hypothetical protein